MGHPVALAEPDFGESYPGSITPRDRWMEMFCGNIDREDPMLIQVVEEMGAAANGDCAELSITEIPSDVDWEIKEYDGLEWIAEKHRTW